MKTKIKKSEVIEQVAAASGLTQVDAEKAMNAFLKVITNELVEGNDFPLQGIGTISVTDRPAREGRNPQTGEAMPIKASKSVRLKASKTIKDILNA